MRWQAAETELTRTWFRFSLLCLEQNQDLLIWTYVGVIGHRLSTSLDKLGHWVIWVLLPVLIPQSFLMQGLPCCLSLDQRKPSHTTKSMKNSFHPVHVWKVWLLKVRWSVMAFRFSLRNITKRSPFNRSAYSGVKCQRNDSRLLFNHLHQTYLTRHSEKATRADSTTSHFIMLVTLLWDWSSVLIYHIIRLGLQSALPHNLISHASSR